MLVYQRVVLCVTASRPRAWCYPRVSSLSCSLGGAADPVEPSRSGPVGAGEAQNQPRRPTAEVLAEKLGGAAFAADQQNKKHLFPF